MAENSSNPLRRLLRRLVPANRARIADLERQVQDLTQRFIEHHEKIHHLWLNAERITGFAKDEEPMFIRFSDFFDQSRGDPQAILDQQRMYLPEFVGKKRVVDLGCGRGEFVDLLRDNGIGAEGVDIDPALCEQARAKGLTIHQADLFPWLREQPDASFDGIFCAQVVEHIPLPGVDQLVAECHRILQPGGRLILETLNPSNLNVFMGPYWADPGHRQPIHPWTLCVICQTQQFIENRVVYSATPPEEFRLHPVPTEGLSEETAKAIEGLNAEISKVNDSLYGPGQYAVISAKPAQ